MGRPTLKVVLPLYFALLFIAGYTIKLALLEPPERSKEIIHHLVPSQPERPGQQRPNTSNANNQTNGGAVDKMLVVSRYKEDVTWVPVYLGNFPFVVYSKEDLESIYRVPHNQGGEATAYL
jgi:hypothetical protein